jgi:hypothetical protein
MLMLSCFEWFERPRLFCLSFGLTWASLDDQIVPLLGGGGGGGGAVRFF